MKYNDCAPYVTIGDRISLMTTSYAVAMNPVQNDVSLQATLGGLATLGSQSASRDIYFSHPSYNNDQDV
jgi:hypothetical protein